MAPNEITKEKQSLRKEFLKLREKLTDTEVEQKSKIIVEKISLLKEFKLAKNVLLYYPFRKEVDVLKLLIHKDKNFYFPIVDFSNKQLLIGKYNGKFIKNKLGIYEPEEKIDEKILEIIDIVIVPGVVFSKNGYRIGYGGGYYDKLLKKINTLSFGVCYDFQIIDFLPIKETDSKVNYIISESYFIKT